MRLKASKQDHGNCFSYIFACFFQYWETIRSRLWFTIQDFFQCSLFYKKIIELYFWSGSKDQDNWIVSYFLLLETEALRGKNYVIQHFHGWRNLSFLMCFSLGMLHKLLIVRILNFSLYFQSAVNHADRKMLR